jgi:MFS family permease
VYQVQSSGTLLQVHRRLLSRARGKAAGREALVSRTVIMLGLTSLFTDISSEMVATVLPLYLVYVHGFSPLQFGIIDGIYQGASALVRVGSGFLADRKRRYKEVAVAGYGLSAICRIGLLTAGSGLTAIGGIVLADRTGKGIRTAPRDAMISLSTKPESLGIAFGVHRALDTTGAMIGPLLAFAILAAAPLAFHSLFMVSLCFAVIGVAVLVLFVPRGTPRPATEEAPSLRAAANLLTERQFRALVLAGAALALMTASDAFIYLGLREHVDISAEVFPLLYVGTALVFMTLAVPIGRLADTIGRGKVFVGGYALLFGVYALVLMPGVGTAGLVAVLMLMGVYYASTDGVLAALGSAVLPEDLRGSGLALLATATGLAQLGASIVLGTLWATLGPQAAFRSFAAGLVISVAAAAIVMARARRTVAA